MSSLNYECKPLQWDTDYFGVRSARVNLHGSVDERGQEDIIEFCKAYGFITIANLNNTAENNHWIGEKTDAFLADVNIKFLKVLVDRPDHQCDMTNVFNNCPRNEQILHIASNSFYFSRFFSDPKLPKMLAKNIYYHWTECAFEREDKFFVVCERDGNVAGYILFSVHEDDGVIQLIAVDEKYQGQRVGSSMVQAMEAFVKKKGINKIKVGTQVNNIAAVQFYLKMGFSYVGCASIYHLCNY